MYTARGMKRWLLVLKSDPDLKKKKKEEGRQQKTIPGKDALLGWIGLVVLLLQNTREQHNLKGVPSSNEQGGSMMLEKSQGASHVWRSIHNKKRNLMNFLWFYICIADGFKSDLRTELHVALKTWVAAKKQQPSVIFSLPTVLNILAHLCHESWWLMMSSHSAQQQQQQQPVMRSRGQTMDWIDVTMQIRVPKHFRVRGQSLS